MTKIIEGARDRDLAEIVVDDYRVARQSLMGRSRWTGSQCGGQRSLDSQSDCGMHVIEEFSRNSCATAEATGDSARGR